MRVEEALALFPSKTEGEVLVAFASGRDRSWVFAHPKALLSPSEEQRILSCSARRNAGEPIAYIRGTQEFYGRPFRCDPRVLIPRQATETLVETALEWYQEPFDVLRDSDNGIVVMGLRTGRPGPTRAIADIGTGSGCIAVTLACETKLPVYATDIASDALDVAKENAAALKAKEIHFVQGDGIAPLQTLDRPFVIVSNPPYVPREAKIGDDVRFEPAQAVFAGQDGLDVLLPLFRDAMRHPLCRGILVECRHEHVHVLKDATGD